MTQTIRRPSPRAALEQWLAIVNRGAPGSSRALFALSRLKQGFDSPRERHRHSKNLLQYQLFHLICLTLPACACHEASYKTSSAEIKKLSEPQYLTKRHGVWHFLRRVPSEYAHLDTRGNVKLSTKIKVAADRKGTKAGQVAARMNETLEAYWRGLADRKTAQAKHTYLDAVKLARSLGLDYQTPAVTAMAPIEDVLARIETLLANGMMNNAPLRRAALGAFEKPPIMLSSLFTEYEQTQRIALSKMSPDQVRKWTSAKKRAVEILIEQKGDKPLHQLSRDDALSYSDWWEDRVLTDGIGAGTANKNISHIGGMIRAVNKRLKLGLDDVFAATRIEGGRDGQRAPFPRRIHPRCHSCSGQARRSERGSARRGLCRDGNRRATERDREPDCGADRSRRSDSRSSASAPKAAC